MPELSEISDLNGLDVLLLGAGFSRAVHDSMPLMKDLSAAIRQELSQTYLQERIDRIPFLDSNFELAMSYLAQGQPWMREAYRLRNRALFLEIADAINRIIIRAQRAMSASAPECPDWLMQLVYWLHFRAATVITLNYDTVLEMAVTEIYFGGGESYLSEFLRPFSFPAREGRLHAKQPDTLKLLKLHGSIHWTYSGSETYFGESIYDTEVPRWSVAARTASAYGAADGRVPLIVPPTLDKNRYFENEKLRSLWMSAAIALRAARRIFCVGYSLPEGDLLMRFLLHDALDSKRPVPFHLVNTAPETIDHFKKQLKGTKIELDETYVRDGDINTVRDFATALAHEKLPDTRWATCIANGLSELVIARCKPGSSHRNHFTEQNFIVRRVDTFGVLLPDPGGEGTRYCPWSAFSKLIQKGRDRQSNLHAELSEGHEMEKEMFSLLLSLQLIIRTESSDGISYTMPVALAT